CLDERKSKRKDCDATPQRNGVNSIIGFLNTTKTADTVAATVSISAQMNGVFLFITVLVNRENILELMSELEKKHTGGEKVPNRSEIFIRIKLIWFFTTGVLTGELEMHMEIICRKVDRLNALANGAGLNGNRVEERLYQQFLQIIKHKKFLHRSVTKTTHTWKLYLSSFYGATFIDVTLFIFAMIGLLFLPMKLAKSIPSLYPSGSHAVITTLPKYFIYSTTFALYGVMVGELVMHLERIKEKVKDFVEEAEMIDEVYKMSKFCTNWKVAFIRREIVLSILADYKVSAVFAQIEDAKLHALRCAMVAGFPSVVAFYLAYYAEVSSHFLLYRQIKRL
ncbi:hypothetical protein U1Q18_051149, partial [Sarracenia purpurea var. burkii]